MKAAPIIFQIIAALLSLTGNEAIPNMPPASSIWKPEYFPSVEQLLSRKSGRPFTISVEGNVGSGKTTVLEFFQQYPDMSVYPEPVSRWTNFNGTDYLDLVYRNQTRWGFTFESLVIQTMLDIQLKDFRNFTAQPDLDKIKQKTPAVKLMERSLLATRHIFVRNLNNTIAKPEFKILESWLNTLHATPQLDLGIDLIIYLRTDPNVTYKRIAKRNRHEELKIPLEYFQGLNRLYEDWLYYKNSTGVLQEPRVVIIDANKDISELRSTYRNLAKDIYRSIPKQLKTNKFYKHKN